MTIVGEALYADMLRYAYALSMSAWPHLLTDTADSRAGSRLRHGGVEAARKQTGPLEAGLWSACWRGRIDAAHPVHDRWTARLRRISSHPGEGTRRAPASSTAYCQFERQGDR